MFHDRGEAEGAEDEPDGGEHSGHAPSGEQRVDRFVTALEDESLAHRFVGRLDRGQDGPLLGLAHEVAHHVGLREGRKGAREDRRAEDRQERRHLPQGQDHEKQERQEAQHRDVEDGADGVLRLLRAFGRRTPAGIEAHEKEDDQGDRKGRCDRARHPPDVLLDGHATDDRRDQHGRLGKRGHLVAHVPAGDDRPCRRFRRDMKHRRHADKRDAQRAGGGPGASGDHSDDGADDRHGEIEDRRVEQAQAV